MKVLGIIPARYSSSRFPGKPLIDLKGKTMIQRVYEGALKSQKIDSLIVATDDERIFQEVKRFGGEVILTANDHPNGTSRCYEVLSNYPDFDVVINIQGDEPLVKFEQLDLLIDAFADEKVEIATLGIKTNEIKELDNPNRIKIVTDFQNNALYFSRSKIPFERNSSENYNFLRHIGLYAFRSNTLSEISNFSQTEIEEIESLEQLRWLFYGKKIRVVKTNIETPNIDTPEDLENVLNHL
ncbi:MAG: 3-deoxy-manno-octulosonate cytidylyltransferase [Crocinitomicaceae bacterium]